MLVDVQMSHPRLPKPARSYQRWLASADQAMRQGGICTAIEAHLQITLITRLDPSSNLEGARIYLMVVCSYGSTGVSGVSGA